MLKHLWLLWYADPTLFQSLLDFMFYILVHFGNKMDILKKVHKSFLIIRRGIWCGHTYSCLSYLCWKLQCLPVGAAVISIRCIACVWQCFFLIIKNTFTNKTQERKERMLGVIKLKTSEWKLFEGRTIWEILHFRKGIYKFSLVLIWMFSVLRQCIWLQCETTFYRPVPQLVQSLIRELFSGDDRDCIGKIAGRQRTSKSLNF